MTNEIAKPGRPEYYTVTDTESNVLTSGKLETHLVLTTNHDITNSQDLDDYFEKIDGIVYPDMPPEGTLLDAGDIYAHGPANYIVRQDHIRTAHDPDTVPALFLAWRGTGGELEWIPNEQVVLADDRLHDDRVWRVVQAHVTQTGWEPDATPTLWSLAPEGEWPAWVQPQGGHDAYPDKAKVTHNEDKWISNTPNNVWEPGAAGITQWDKQ